MQISNCCFLEPVETYNLWFVPRWEGPLLSRQVGNYRIEVQERSCSCCSLHVHSRIGSPYPIFSVLLFELDTGVVQSIHKTKYQRWWLHLAQSKTTAIIQRDTIGRLQTTRYFTPPLAFSAHYTVSSTYHVNIFTYFPCNVNWLTHALIHLSCFLLLLLLCRMLPTCLWSGHNENDRLNPACACSL